MFALDAKTGKPVWRTNTSKVAPYGHGGFFSSPAIGFGRVYAARDDGTVYAFDEQTGKVEWSFDAGDYVYGSPAVARVPGTPPSVYIGAENGRFFALDAGTGKARWHYDVGGPIPGTATVIGHTVYTSSFKTQETTGLDAHTGKRTFHIKQADGLRRQTPLPGRLLRPDRTGAALADLALRPADLEVEEAEVGTEQRLGDVVDGRLADRPVRRAGVRVAVEDQVGAVLKDRRRQAV
jgi:hypothetical protein